MQRSSNDIETSIVTFQLDVTKKIDPSIDPSIILKGIITMENHRRNIKQ